MNELAARKCKPCEGGTAPLTHTQAQQLLGQLSGAWALTENARALRREFAFRDFYRTMSFVNALAHIANIEDHHPDLEVGYNYCRDRKSTRLNSSHLVISYAVFCLKKKKKTDDPTYI